MAVLYMVTNKTKDKFSAPNLSSYLRKKGLAVAEGPTPEEAILANAELLLEHLHSQGDAPRASKSMLRHELVGGAVRPDWLWDVFPAMKAAYVQQGLDYGRGSRYGDKWKISCYLVVMENWKPKIYPHEPMVQCMSPVMNECVAAFRAWYCRVWSVPSVDASVMNAFITRYRAIDGEDQLKKHIDGSNVDGSVVLALPTDDPPESGGAIHFWDGKPQKELVYHMKPGDAIFLLNAVWHQAMPITSGTRWALVIFLRLRSATAGKQPG